MLDELYNTFFDYIREIRPSAEEVFRETLTPQVREDIDIHWKIRRTRRAGRRGTTYTWDRYVMHSKREAHRFMFSPDEAFVLYGWFHRYCVAMGWDANLQRVYANLEHEYARF